MCWKLSYSIIKILNNPWLNILLYYMRSTGYNTISNRMHPCESSSRSEIEIASVPRVSVEIYDNGASVQVEFYTDISVRRKG